MINGNIPGKKQREADNIQQHYLRQIFNHIFSNYLTEKRRQPYAVVAKRSFNSALCKAFQSASLLEIQLNTAVRWRNVLRFNVQVIALTVDALPGIRSTPLTRSTGASRAHSRMPMVSGYRISVEYPAAGLISLARCSDCDASVDALAAGCCFRLFHDMLMRMRGAGGQLRLNCDAANPEDDRQLSHAHCELIVDRHHFAHQRWQRLLTFEPSHGQFYWRQ